MQAAILGLSVIFFVANLVWALCLIRASANAAPRPGAPAGDAAVQRRRPRRRKADVAPAADVLHDANLADWKEARRQLGDYQRRVANLMSNLPGLVYRCRNTAEWPMEFISQGCIDLTGYAPEDFIENRVSLGQLIHPDDQDVVWSQVQQAVAEQRQFQLSYRIRNAAGDERWVWEQGMGIFDEDGQLAAIEGFITDISERKRTEHTLQQTERQFRQAQKLEAVGRLAGGIAHDFNNVVTIVNGYCDLLAAELPADDHKQEMIQIIKEAGTRAGAMTRQLLAFSRKQVLAPKVLDPHAVIVDMEKMLQRLIGEDIHLRTVVDAGVGQIKADPSQIEQVVMNLVINARDAMPQGGKVTIEIRNVELDSSYADSHWEVKPGRYVLVAISDNGCGMDQETLGRIFEPFFSTKEEGKGTGLGLATVFGIVKQSGGHISVYSEVGLGTTFKIYLPRVEQARLDQCVPRSVVESPRGHETVLLVEDETDLRTLARLVLEDAGYTVLAASNGHQAIETAAQYDGPIHLLLTDVVMPHMSGRELAERLALERPAIAVLFTSGYTDDAVVHHGVLEADVAFLQKPFAPDDLKRKAREALDAAPQTTSIVAGSNSGSG